MREHASEPKADKTLTLSEQLKQTEDITKLRRELEQVIIKVNYHFQSGYERHVNLQTPESIFLNFLKKGITIVPSSYLYRICKKDFSLLMDVDKKFVDGILFHVYSTKYTWQNLDDKLKLLNEAARLIDYEELKAKSHTLDKWYQTTDKLINSIKDFSFK